TKIVSIASGLTALGLAFLSATAIVADGPAAPQPVGAPAPPAAPAVLLLTDGRIVNEGTILETEDGYLVQSRFGERTIPRRQVEHAFGSMAEIYEYKVERLPARDTDERLALARWCLQQKMLPEAEEQLQAVLTAVPDHGPAKAMLFQIKSLGARPAMPD